MNNYMWLVLGVTLGVTITLWSIILFADHSLEIRYNELKDAATMCATNGGIKTVVVGNGGNHVYICDNGATFYADE